jgi:hypothetical protein
MQCDLFRHRIWQKHGQLALALALDDLDTGDELVIAE